MVCPAPVTLYWLTVPIRRIAVFAASLNVMSSPWALYVPLGTLTRASPFSTLTKPEYLRPSSTLTRTRKPNGWGWPSAPIVFTISVYIGNFGATVPLAGISALILVSPVKRDVRLGNPALVSAFHCAVNARPNAGDDFGVRYPRAVPPLAEVMVMPGAAGALPRYEIRTGSRPFAFSAAFRPVTSKRFLSRNGFR